MQELVVIVAGLVLGLAAGRIASTRLRVAAVAVGAVAVGSAWSRIVGEAEALALWDSTQALVAAVAGLAISRVVAQPRGDVPPLA